MQVDSRWTAVKSQIYMTSRLNISPPQLYPTPVPLPSPSPPPTPLHYLYHALCGCSERLAQVQLSVEQDPEMTFAPAINERSMRIAISKELRQVREDVPFANRLTLRQPPKLTAGKGPFTDVCYRDEGEGLVQASECIL